MAVSKLRIAFVLPAFGLGGGYKKYLSYVNNLSPKLCDISVISIQEDISSYVGFLRPIEYVSPTQIKQFCKDNAIQYVYCGASLSDSVLDDIATVSTLLFNVNFLPQYQYRKNALYFAISQALYYKMISAQNIHVAQTSVVYNPIPVLKWKKMVQKKPLKKESAPLIIGRLARAEPSKWDFLIIATTFELQFSKRKIQYLFAGCPLLYRIALRVFCPFANIRFLPQLQTDQDIAKFYNSIDLFWQTSSAGETFGNAIAESYCFAKPVLSDSKHFLKKDGTVIQSVDNAQLELVDANITGKVLFYPSSIISFLQSVSFQTLGEYGLNAQKKVSQFDAVTSCNSLMKHLYSHARKNGFSQQSAFESLSIFPTNPTSFSRQYDEKLYQSYVENKPTSIEKVMYPVFLLGWKCCEFTYLCVRKLLRFANIDIEKNS